MEDSRGARSLCVREGLYRMEFEGEELSFASGTKLAMTVKGLKDLKKK